MNYPMTFAGMAGTTARSDDPIQAPALAILEQQIADTIKVLHTHRQVLQGIRSRALGDIPESDPPSPANAKPVPNGSVGRLGELMAELRLLGVSLSEHATKIQSIV